MVSVLTLSDLIISIEFSGKEQIQLFSKQKICCGKHEGRLF
jgi:hypothetical protein